MPFSSLLCRARAATSGRELGVWEASLEDRADFVSRWTLSYVSPLLQVGAQKVLEADDIGVPSRQDEAHRAYARALRQWRAEAKKAHNLNEQLLEQHAEVIASSSSSRTGGSGGGGGGGGGVVSKSVSLNSRSSTTTTTAGETDSITTFSNSNPSSYADDSTDLQHEQALRAWKEHSDKAEDLRLELKKLRHVILESRNAAEEAARPRTSEAEDAQRAYEAALRTWKDLSAQTARINKRLVQHHDEMLAECQSEAQRRKIREPSLKEPSVSLALLKAFGIHKVFFGIFLYVVASLLDFLPVIILNDLVNFLSSGQQIDDYKDGYLHPWIEVAMLAGVPVLSSLLQTRHLTVLTHAATFAKTAVSMLLYRKALRVSAAGRAQTSTGQVVNMMSNDTAQIQQFVQFLGVFLVAPIQVLITIIFIFQQVGHATWVGLGFMILLAPLNTVVFHAVAQQRREVIRNSDARVKMMNEILNGIRIIKFYAWERPFAREVGKLRFKELHALTRKAFTSTLGFSLVQAAPLIQPVLVFVTYVALQNKPLDPATAFTTVALFNLMRYPFAFMLMGMLRYIQFRISTKRIERYLDLPELYPYVKSSAHPNPPPLDAETANEIGSVTVYNGNFSWADPDGKIIRPIQDERVPRKRRRNRKGSASTVGDDKLGNPSSAQYVGDAYGPQDRASTPNSTLLPPILTLKDLNFHIRAGSLVAVVGPVGSGKSSFLSAILGEMEPVNGSKVYIPRPPSVPRQGFISYCTQTPWVVNDSVLGNVLFGRKLIPSRYDEVVEACALDADLRTFPAGDLTEIGERGINLSGGQKARVALARALYSEETKLMLLDDPLSAVDAHVGEHIFRHAIAGPMCKGITRILVTHHVHLLPSCDQIIVLDDGQIRHQGTFDELMEQGVDFFGALDFVKNSDDNNGKGDEDEEEDEDDGDDDEVSVPSDKAQQSRGGGEARGKDKINKQGQIQLGNNQRKGEADDNSSGGMLVQDEEREEGGVAGSAYKHYAKVGGMCNTVLIFSLQGLGRVAEVMSSFWLATWADRSYQAYVENDPFTKSKTQLYAVIYVLFGIPSLLCIASRALFIAIHRLRASKRLHDDLTQTILRAPVAFFDVTPTGRILNRFSSDMDKIDLEVSSSLAQGISTVATLLGGIGAIVAATKGTFLVALIPFSYIYYRIQKWFRMTSTELQRVNRIASSPVFSDFSQTLSGPATIRAYGDEKRFFNKCKSNFDKMNASFMLLELANNWLGLRLDSLGGCVGAFVAAVAVGTSSIGFIPAGWLGLALSYSIEVTSYLEHGVRRIARIEAEMSSVERVLYYTNNVDAEAPEYTSSDPPTDHEWPKDGGIEFQNASMRYRDGPIVLKNLSFQVRPGEKIGVCGRSGSGKSSLMVSLFRITEIEKDGGKILIDGVNTRDLGTSTLRLSLSIIPQDPVIFSNTVRFNLDPFGFANDEELWEVLRQVQMEEVVAWLPGCLDQVVAESGENFSQGQRQLLCIARALLRKPKILVLDEATASIDNATDAIVQQMIRQNFQNATVLTIAHRLNTIMDSDRILVLDRGRLSEYDTPQHLLMRENGMFRAMVEKSRDAQARKHNKRGKEQ